MTLCFGSRVQPFIRAVKLQGEWGVMTFGMPCSLIALPPKQKVFGSSTLFEMGACKKPKWLRMCPATKINSALIIVKLEQVTCRS